MVSTTSYGKAKWNAERLVIICGYMYISAENNSIVDVWVSRNSKQMTAFSDLGCLITLLNSFFVTDSVYARILWIFFRMSDNVPLYTQRACTACADDEQYNLDLFSFVQPPVFGTKGSLNQLIMYVTRAIDSGRLPFIQVWNFIMAYERTLTSHNSS